MYILFIFLLCSVTDIYSIYIYYKKYKNDARNAVVYF